MREINEQSSEEVMDWFGKHRLSSDMDEGNSVISKTGLKGDPSKYKV